MALASSSVNLFDLSSIFFTAIRVTPWVELGKPQVVLGPPEHGLERDEVRVLDGRSGDAGSQPVILDRTMS